jgi:hypothetical protein
MSHQIAIVATVRPGKADELARVLAEGPPFDLAERGFTKHAAFLGDNEVVLVFEGEQPLTDARKLLKTVGLGHITRLVTLAASPRLLCRSFVWTADAEREVIGVR